MSIHNFCHVVPVGNLTVFEVYVYYDGPKLFACRNASEQVFIAVWIDDGATHDSWLLVPVRAHSGWRAPRVPSDYRRESGRDARRNGSGRTAQAGAD
jgi:hypothetical protein